MVTLELIDASSGEALGDVTVPFDSLPERFEDNDTLLSLGATQYRVVGADPSSRALIARSGRARVLLSREPDPAGQRFAQPSIEETSPAIDASVDPAGAIALRADNWRQCELVAADQREAVDAELADVRAIGRATQGPPGFATRHRRRRVPAPLNGTGLTLDEVIGVLGGPARPLAIRGVGVVRDGFALPHGDALVYGTAPGGIATVVAVQGIVDDVAGLLHPIAWRHRLLLVEWCVPRRLRALDEGFAD